MTAKEVTTVPFAPGPPPTCSSRQCPLPWCACAHVSVRRGRPPSAPAALRPWRDLPRMGAERNMAAVVRDRDGALLVRPTHTHLCTWQSLVCRSLVLQRRAWTGWTVLVDV